MADKKTLSEEHRKNLSLAMKGKRHSEETKARMRANWADPETKARRSAAIKAGMTPETRAKRAASLRAFWERQKKERAMYMKYATPVWDEERRTWKLVGPDGQEWTKVIDSRLD